MLCKPREKVMNTSATVKSRVQCSKKPFSFLQTESQTFRVVFQAFGSVSALRHVDSPQHITSFGGRILAVLTDFCPDIYSLRNNKTIASKEIVGV